MPTIATMNRLTIEQLQERWRTLDAERIKAETNLKNAQDQLERLRREARDEFGTDDVAELQAKLDGIRAENERKRAEYQRHVEDIEHRLREVDEGLAGARKEDGQ